MQKHIFNVPMLFDGTKKYLRITTPRRIYQKKVCFAYLCIKLP